MIRNAARWASANKTNLGFSPPDIPGLIHWFDASDGASVIQSGGLVSQWSDKVGTMHMTQAASNEQPSIGVNTMNGRNVLTFNQAHKLRNTTAGVMNVAHDGTGLTIFMVMKVGNVANPNALYGLMGTNIASSVNTGFSVYWDDRASVPRNEVFVAHVSSSTGSPVGSSTTLDLGAPVQTPWIGRVYLDADNANANQNVNVGINSGALRKDNTWNNAHTTADHTFPFEIGSIGNGTFGLVGDVAEILMYSPRLSNFHSVGTSGDQEDQVIAYLTDKWGIV